jgi:phosphotransferase system enzyme I (PtsI)
VAVDATEPAGAARARNVGIVVVSHSPDVARGTADMVRQMVGDAVPLAWCGGDPGGGLGTDVAAIQQAIERAWSERGVAILVDLGGAETSSAMAVELLPDDRRPKVVVCDAPIVEGAVVAATEASGGATLEAVRRVAEALTPARKAAAPAAEAAAPARESVRRAGEALSPAWEVAQSAAEVPPPVREAAPRSTESAAREAGPRAAEVPSPAGEVVQGRVLVTHPVGLHARPSVKLTTLAKTFGARIDLALAEDGPWVDAKSVVEVMATKAPPRSVLYFRASGDDAAPAVRALVALVERDFVDGDGTASFPESPPESPCELRARPAAPGLALGPLAILPDDLRARRTAGDPATEAAALTAALTGARADLARLAAASWESRAAEILEVQIAMLADAALADPAMAAIARGAAADAAWASAVDAQIGGYEAAGDEYFRARAADLRDLRDRVLRLLTGEPPAEAVPPGAIVVARDLPPSRFLEIDWSRGGGIALAAGSPSSHVAMLARGRGVPMVVGLGAVELGGHREALVDGGAGRLLLSPDEDARRRYHERRDTEDRRQREEARFLLRPARTGDGRPIAVRINVAAPEELALLDPAGCDGIGLARTEFLFHGGDLPAEERQYALYRTMLAWAGGRPVTIRTLDAGGDKPIPGLTVSGESNPFLGVRGIRLSLARPEVFRVQLRALARAAVHGDLGVMLPMVTVPDEVEAARRLLDEVLAELRAAGTEARRPRLGIMVEVPAAALALDAFEADFYSIGSNDLTQYLTASARDVAAVAELANPAHPAVLQLIESVVREGVRQGREVSLCGDMAGEPEHVPRLLRCGLSVLSVAPAALARTKAAIAAFRAGAPTPTRTRRRRP